MHAVGTTRYDPNVDRSKFGCTCFVRQFATPHAVKITVLYSVLG